MTQTTLIKLWAHGADHDMAFAGTLSGGLGFLWFGGRKLADRDYLGRIVIASPHGLCLQGRRRHAKITRYLDSRNIPYTQDWRTR